VPDSALAELAYRKPRVILFARLGIRALAQMTERVVWITCGPRPCIASRHDCVTADPL